MNRAHLSGASLAGVLLILALTPGMASLADSFITARFRCRLFGIVGQDSISEIDDRLQALSAERLSALSSQREDLAVRLNLAEALGEDGIASTLRADISTNVGQAKRIEELLAASKIKNSFEEGGGPDTQGPVPGSGVAILDGENGSPSECGREETEPPDGTSAWEVATTPQAVALMKDGETPTNPGASAPQQKRARHKASKPNLKALRDRFYPVVRDLEEGAKGDNLWRIRVKSTVCVGRALLQSVGPDDSEHDTLGQEFRRVVELTKSDPGFGYFFGLDMASYASAEQWDSAAAAFELFILSQPAVEWLSSTPARFADPNWHEVLQRAAAAESFLYRALEEIVPGARDSEQTQANDRLRQIRDCVYVNAWNSSVATDDLRREAQDIAPWLARAQRPEQPDPKPKARSKPTSRDQDRQKGLTTQLVLDLHWALVEFFMGNGDPIEPPGPRDIGLLESALSRPWTSLGGTEKYVTLSQKSAALVHSLILNHAFHNGNKRTALAALVVFLRLNEHVLNAEEDELFEFLLRVASGTLLGELRNADLEVEAMATFIRERTLIIGPPRAMKLGDFIRKCEEMGCYVKEKRDNLGYTVRNGSKSITVNRNIRELEGPVVKAYISKLGLGEAHSGVAFENFASEDLSPKGVVAKYQKIFRRLAAYG